MLGQRSWVEGFEAKAAAEANVQGLRLESQVVSRSVGSRLEVSQATAQQANLFILAAVFSEVVNAMLILGVSVIQAARDSVMLVAWHQQDNTLWHCRSLVCSFPSLCGSVLVFFGSVPQTLNSLLDDLVLPSGSCLTVRLVGPAVSQGELEPRDPQSHPRVPLAET
eukprot:1312825-Rhodomonas_salina.1